VNKPPGAWKAGNFIGAIVECRPTIMTVDETMLPGGEGIGASSRDEAFFSPASSYLSVEPRGLAMKGGAH
jgi:hypothetical protein